MSITALVSLIYRSFYRNVERQTSESYYVVDVFGVDDEGGARVIVYSYGEERSYSVPYALATPTPRVSADVTFAPREEWTEVESTWVPIEREAAQAAVRAILAGAEDEGVGAGFALVTREAAELGSLTGVVGGSMRRLTFASEVRMASTGDRSTFCVATDAVARDGMALDVEGLDVAAYNANPVVLWQHGRDPQRGNVPIGRCASLVRNDTGGVRRWVATVDWEPDPFAQQIRDQVARGVISMASIGFVPTAPAERRTTNGVSRAVVPSAEMLEFSIVAVGSDRGALAIERSAEGEDRLDRIERAVERLAAALAPPTVTNSLTSGATAPAAPASTVVTATAERAAETVPAAPAVTPAARETEARPLIAVSLAVLQQRAAELHQADAVAALKRAAGRA